MAQASAKRKTLTQQRILGEAASLLQAKGSAGFSIRQLANALGVAPMAIYHHFENKDALLSALLDTVIREADVLPDEELPWDQWLLQLGQNMEQAHKAYAGWVGLMAKLKAPAEGLELLTRSLNVLTRAGFSDQQALGAFMSVVKASMGSAVLSLGLQRLDYSGVLTPASTPIVFDLLKRFDSLESLTFAQDAQYGLKLLIDGLRMQLQENL